MNIKNNWFSVYMFLVIGITMTMIIQNNKRIIEFKKNSINQIVTVQIDKPEEVEIIKKRLQGATHQPVFIEFLGENKYRILLRCPPDKYDELEDIVNQRKMRLMKN